MMIFEHPIYPITKDSKDPTEIVSQVRAFVRAGVSLLQIRAKNLSSAAFFEIAEQSVHLAVGSGTRIIINDRVDVALAAGAHGVHLGQTDLSPVDARKILGDGFLIGFSTHNSDQFEEAQKLPLDYIAIGPIFQTSSKQNPDPVVGTRELTRLASMSSKPIVAIGGISGSNIGKVAESGASAAALIGAVAGVGEPAEELIQELKEQW